MYNVLYLKAVHTIVRKYFRSFESTSGSTFVGTFESTKVPSRYFRTRTFFVLSNLPPR